MCGPPKSKYEQEIDQRMQSAGELLHLSEEQRLSSSVQPGRYRHYKGCEYHVLGIARHSESEEELVVYRALYGDFGLWVRPLAMFLEPVTIDGRQLPRFALLERD